MPDHFDHALPLRIERSPTELRIEAQTVVATLARELHVDGADDGPSFGQELDDNAKLLDHARASKAAAALDSALELLEKSDVARALTALREGQRAQCEEVRRRMAAVTAARQALASADKDHAARAREDLRIDVGCLKGEADGLDALDKVIKTLEETKSAIVGIERVRQRQHAIAVAEAELWASLSELIWKFDAHLQDGLSANSETQAMAYQLGRGLAETYWALDPDTKDGTSRSWNFLLGEKRCSELSRLVGRLCAYFPEYTGPAITSSVEVWKDVVGNPKWLGEEPADRRSTAHHLYKQTRRWWELLVLRQDPTTLVRPGAVMTDYRALRRAAKMFWPQLAGILVGLTFLIVLTILVSFGSGPPWVKALSGIVGVGGLSIAGLTGALRNSAQAMLKRWRQDAYTDLIAEAVQTAPSPPRGVNVMTPISRRTLTPSTPN
jgi:hypothetical protein